MPRPIHNEEWNFKYGSYVFLSLGLRKLRARGELFSCIFRDSSYVVELLVLLTVHFKRECLFAEIFQTGFLFLLG